MLAPRDESGIGNRESGARGRRFVVSAGKAVPRILQTTDYGHRSRTKLPPLTNIPTTTASVGVSERRTIGMPDINR
jgi:hypothetical protein